jgi:hypothetical protein
MTSMDEQGRAETPLAGWDTVGWEADPTGIGTWSPKTPLTGSMRSGRVTNGSSGGDRDIECVAVLHRMASIGIKADAEDSSRQPRETT